MGRLICDNTGENSVFWRYSTCIGPPEKAEVKVRVGVYTVLYIFFYYFANSILGFLMFVVQSHKLF